MRIITCISAIALFSANACRAEDPFSGDFVGESNFRLPVQEVKDLYGEKYCDPAVGLLRENALALRAADEMSLYQKRIKTEEQSVLRLTIVGTFEKSLILRMHSHNHRYYIAVKRLDAGSEDRMELARIELLGQIEISRKHYFDLLEYAARDSIRGLSKMTMSQRLDTMSSDSSSWSLEVCKVNSYCVIDLFSPRPLEHDASGISPHLTRIAMEDFLFLANSLLRLSGMKL